MNAPKRIRARVLTPEGLKQLREQVRSHEQEHNAGFKYTLERLGELTGLDPESVKNVLDGKGADKRTIARCFETFGLTLEDRDHVPAAQAIAAQADPNFVGREGAIAELNQWAERGARVIVIQARGGVGKTTLARRYLTQAFGTFLEFPIAKETRNIASIEALVEEKLRQLGEEPGREFLVSLDRLKRKLQGARIGILIDNLEPALDADGKFVEAHRGYVELLRVLADPAVQSLTLITTRERLREPAVSVQHYGLKTLNVSAWGQFFQGRDLPTDTPGLAALHHAYGGNAKAMDIISGAIWEDFSGDVAAYWQANQDDLLVERDLEDLVRSQFDRLQQLAPEAYRLLCRMGCYRYQDVPTVPIEGLFCLLWDVPEGRHRRVVKSLQDRSLIDYENGEFWLHPVIRAEAIGRLKRNEGWKEANYKAAEYWTERIKIIVDINDAIQGFESFYHYLAVDDFEKAGSVILERRESRSADYEKLELGRSFYRLGLIKHMTIPINKIINRIQPTFNLSRLYNILGTSYRILGKLLKAIELHRNSIKIAVEYLDSSPEKGDKDHSEFRFIQKTSLINIGCCEIELRDFRQALKTFKSIDREFLKDDEYDQLGVCTVDLFLAFSYSHLNLNEEASKLIEKVYSQMKREKKGGTGYRLIILGRVYKKLDRINQSIDVFHEVVSHAEEFEYPDVKAMALSEMAEIYRIQNELDLAVEKHLEAILIFESSGALCSLAEAYYQLGLSYQVMNEFEKSNENFQKAIQLFGEMGVPKQVERVRQSMKKLKVKNSI